MFKKYISVICCFVLSVFIFCLSASTYSGYLAQAVPVSSDQPFADVPADSVYYDAVTELRGMGITEGIGSNRFGYGKTITRGEFITWLVNIMGWEQVDPKKASFKDNQDIEKTYYKPIETALARGVISKNTARIRPSDPVTREEATVMTVNSLGWGGLAGKLSYLGTLYKDVKTNSGYITMARDFGFIDPAPAFNPLGKLLKEEAARMLVRLNEARLRPLKDLNAFYAISSSSQQDKIADLTSASFGWSRLSYDPESGHVVVNSSSKALGYNEYSLPKGFSERLNSARESGVPALLMINATQDMKITDPLTGSKTGIPEFVLTNPGESGSVITEIAASVNELANGEEKGSFDGVVIDFEGLRGDKLKKSFNEFLKNLRAELDKDGKKLYVAVQPLINKKYSSSCFDGYDYRTIGIYADKVILMAHDYDAKKLSASDMARGFNITPPTPIENIYYALEKITDSKTGVQDKSKIMLQISFDWIVWQKENGKTVNSTAEKFNLANFMDLLNTNKKITYLYAKDYENPYIKYIDTKTGFESTVWYENTASVMKKVDLARLFGIQGISLWRLGTIPDYQPVNGKDFDMDVWQSILHEMEKD
ncbi:MAG TPA: glycosyl hydrolase family 18 protein [Clostridia bacterium]|nr:glycosyl hydrolase family 18 protein [Clostridia bacterium]